MLHAFPTKKTICLVFWGSFESGFAHVSRMAVRAENCLRADNTATASFERLSSGVKDAVVVKTVVVETVVVKAVFEDVKVVFFSFVVVVV